MKRTRLLSMLLAAMLLITAAAMPVFAANIDFDKYIAEYTPNFFNDQSLEVGKSHKPTSAVWMGSSDATCQSSDESVVTVTEDGTVTAVGEGTAYVVYIASTGMYDTYRYQVTGAVQPQEPTQDEAVIPEETQTAPEELLEIPIPPTPDTPELPDMGVDMVSSLGFIGVMLNALLAVLGMVATFLMGAGGMILFMLPVLAIVIFLIYRIVRLSSTSMKKRELLPRQETENTVKVAAAARTTCPKCGKEFGDAEFCPSCGTPKQRKNIYTFPIDKPMTAQKFEKMANQWLAENPYIYDCKLHIDTKSSLLIPLVDYKFFVKKASIEFSVADQPRQEKYGFAFLYKFRLFGPIGYSSEKHVAEWNKNNPESTVLKQHAGRIQHFGTRSGIYAQYYAYILFKN